MAQDGRKRRWIVLVSYSQISVAHPGRSDLDKHFVVAGFLDVDRIKNELTPLALEDRCISFHIESPSPALCGARSTEKIQVLVLGNPCIEQ